MVIFFTSPIGLGHATRDIAIAEKLQDDSLFVSGEGAAKLIERKGFKVLDVYHPDKFIVESGQLQHSFKWLMNYLSYYNSCKKIAKDVLEKCNNTNMIVVSDEDFASIAIAEKMGRKCVLITDILETNFTSGVASLIEKMMNKKMQKMMKACNYVLIPEIGHDSYNFRHVGPIVRQINADRNTLRKRFGFSKRTIVVSVGGTDAGQYLIEKAIEAHKKLNLESELVIVSGPSLSIPDSPEYRNLGFVDNLHELIYAADLVISLAGRSTMDESMVYGTPGIFIPIKNHFEQEQGAARFGYKYDDIFRLDLIIKSKLGQQSNSSSEVVVADIGGGGGGADRSARIISALQKSNS